MAPPRADLEGDRWAGQRGYALLLTLFLLAIATAVGLTVVGNGLAARKLARSASVALGVEERVALATWQVLDRIAQSGKALPSSQTGQVTIDGKTVSVTVMSEAGRIDLNGLSRKALAEAVQALGFPERRAVEASDAIALWRGMDPPGADGKNLRMNGRTALWSLEDLDAVPRLDDDVRACLRTWGTVHARGPFLGKAALEHQDFGTTGFGGGGGLIVGSMIRVMVTENASSGVFRTIALYRGTPALQPGARTITPPAWLILEWMQPVTESGGCPL
ncbi:hypothetical protein AZA_87670 [Nitrospirillum viridazoti Y2]|uniref:General secretion pathway protein K n=1 Tax=Nitrospirillum amazonense TaxID=28077 RepID=A0A560HQV4_9PROT|nr:hypothetical protein [Nitrospirillum amazonense]EGY02703.1 hypothetical protein AZA_87670 [Nitrospirillum amazonense Y2]TWB48958.1 hypothetical protein FBZ92_12760 [Nitrospirillum amazonense]